LAGVPAPELDCRIELLGGGRPAHAARTLLTGVEGNLLGILLRTAGTLPRASRFRSAKGTKRAAVWISTGQSPGALLRQIIRGASPYKRSSVASSG
jgi:hypothetical protein